MVNDFCSFCGSLHFQSGNVTKVCSSCNQITYANPIVKVVLLVKIWEYRNIPSRFTNDFQAGVLLVKDNYWVLPSRIVGLNDLWKDIAVEELFARTGILVYPEDFSLFDLKSEDNEILIFANHKTGLYREEVRSDGIVRMDFTYLPIKLGYESHTLILENYFNGRK